MRILTLALAFAALVPLRAETGYDAWLRYTEIGGDRYPALPAAVVAFGDSAVIQTAQQELVRGVRGMLGRTLRIETRPFKESAIVLGTFSAIGLTGDLTEDAYWLKTVTIEGRPCLVVAASNDRGVLYGVFALLRKMGLGESISPLDEKQVPYAPVRWVNEWNNLDGSIERGYAGPSIFF
jgi:alpha-glucuronidase